MSFRRHGPAYPFPWAIVLRSLHIYGDGVTKVPAPVMDLTLLCACRAWYGGYFRAAWRMVCFAVSNRVLDANLRLHLIRLQAEGFSDEQIEERLFGPRDKQKP